MAHTGHWSLDRVRTYKHPCEKQHKQPSGMLHGRDQEEASEKKTKSSEADKENSFKEVKMTKKQNSLDDAPKLHFTGCSGIE